METQNACRLSIWILLIHLMMCPERGITSFLDIEVKSENAYIRLSDDNYNGFKDCICDSQNICLTPVDKLSDTVNNGAGSKIVQFREDEPDLQNTNFSCKYHSEHKWVECHGKQSDDYTCSNYAACNVLLGLKCPDNSYVFITWNPIQEALVHDYNTTEINLVQCCASTSTGKPTTSNLDTTTTTRERPETTTIDNAANIATTTTEPSVSAPRSNPAPTTTKAERDSSSVTSSNVPTTTDNNTTNQKQQEQHTEEVAEFSPAYFGLLIGVCVASATVSVLVTSFVMIKWHQRQDKSSNNKPNRSHQERQNETVFANNIANHREGNDIEMTETNTSHGTDAQGTSERSTGHGNIPHTNSNNPSSSILQYTATGKYTEVDVPSARPGKVARNDAYAEIKKISVKNPADTNNVNITEDSTYSRLHATRRDMQNLYDILPQEMDDGHEGMNSPYSEVAVPKPGTVLSIL